MAEGAIDVLSIGFDAGAAVAKYQAVKFGATVEAVIQVAAEGDLWIGVAQFAVAAGEITKGKGVTVRVAGLSLMVVGTGGVTFGTLGVSDGAGKVVASNSGARPLGIVYATGVAGDWVPVWLTPGLPLIP